MGNRGSKSPLSLKPKILFIGSGKSEKEQRVDGYSVFIKL